MRLVPAILTYTIDEFKQKLQLASSFARGVQVDFMDGEFAGPRSLAPEELPREVPPIQMEAHLMVLDPIAYLARLSGLPFTKAFFHYEAVTDHRAVIEEIARMGLRPGLAISPATPVSVVADLLRSVHAVLLLGVDLTSPSSGFQTETLVKIQQIRSVPELRRFCVEIGVDGGITLANIGRVAAALPDFVCSGSAIFDASDPLAAFHELQAHVNRAAS